MYDIKMVDINKLGLTDEKDETHSSNMSSYMCSEINDNSMIIAVDGIMYVTEYEIPEQDWEGYPEKATITAIYILVENKSGNYYAAKLDMSIHSILFTKLVEEIDKHLERKFDEMVKERCPW